MPRKITRYLRLDRCLFSNAKAEADVHQLIEHGRQQTLSMPAQEVDIKAHSPVPLDSTKPSVTQLPDHVVHDILDLLWHVRPGTLQDVALVSSWLYKQARYVQHQHVLIDLDKEDHVLDRLSLISRLGQAAAVQTVRVLGSKLHIQDDKDHDQILAHLVSMIPFMTGLRHFHWDVSRRHSTSPIPAHFGLMSVPIPSDIMAILSRVGPPLVRLHTSLFCNGLQDSHVQARAILRNLEQCQNLSTLSVDITYTDHQVCFGTMSALKRVLLSCPNLTRLPRIDVHYPRVRCFPGALEDSYCGLGFSHDEKPPPLQELGLLEYPWGGPRRIGYPIETREVDHWASAFDWSRLVHLNDVPEFLMTDMAPHLPMLTELTLNRPTSYGIEVLDDIESPLESLSFSDWKHLGNEPKRITRFAATLQRLRVHQEEPPGSYDNRGFITDSDLILLSTSLPHLQHLALDIERDQEAQQWPYTTLDAIAAFPSLRTVELWFRLGHKPPAPTPLLTVSSARYLGDYLWGRNENLQRMTFHSGAPGPLSGNPSIAFGMDFYIPGPPWAKHNSVTFEYEMVYDSDMTEHRKRSITCLDLSSSMNARLKKLAQGGTRQQTDADELNADDIRLIAALDGPLNKGEWSSWHKRQPEVIAYQAENKRIYDEVEAIINPSLLNRLARLFKR
ncbi:hypothetical protein CDV31_006983 [Fusarium ambrosium]|uniref:Uncharacterized protein n=1 Tax=Fusarium ambrosium TaxID=131363 RepID=A0A428UA54_9HYPO|nr:hypothetical protein CDV31_006983 [Fusarium ambrosium]